MANHWPDQRRAKNRQNYRHYRERMADQREHVIPGTVLRSSIETLFNILGTHGELWIHL